MKASNLLHLVFQVVLLFDALGWEVKMPKVIHGLRGSCLVIPCSFSYTSNPPKNPPRVVWYQWVSSGYPLVYDPSNANKVIEKFRGKTDLFANSSSDCSLLIRNLEQSHHGEKLYTWIDPETVKHSFYDVTSTILIDAVPQSPRITVHGGEKIGETITVVCSTSHTCPYSKPNITLNGIEGSDQIENKNIEDGLWKISLNRTGFVKTEIFTILCTVTHYGGIKITAKEDKTAQCVLHNITIEPELADLKEGDTKIFTCSVYHSCQKETPTITWNYENMQVLEKNETVSGLNRVAYSNIIFLGAKEEHGKKLICTAKYSGGEVTASVVLHVQCIPHNITIEPELADLKEGDTKIFTCSVYHSCQKETPTITWNYENMEENKTVSGLNRVAYSSIIFLGAKEEHGKKLICTAKLSGGHITASVLLNVQYLNYFDLKTFSLYILTPSLVFLIACLFCGLITYKKQQRINNTSTVTGNEPFSKPCMPPPKRSKDAESETKPFSKPRMPSPKSVPKSNSYSTMGYNCEAEYANMEDLTLYENE